MSITRTWTPGELIELEWVANRCDIKQERLIAKLNNRDDDASAVDLRNRLRMKELTATALRQFCEMMRNGK
jgi:hypothetical protein